MIWANVGIFEDFDCFGNSASQVSEISVIYYEHLPWSLIYFDTARATLEHLNFHFTERIEFSVPASSVRNLARQWIGRLAIYRRHRNDEHLEALVEEALRFTGFHLEHDLVGSEYWSKAPLARRVAVLLFLVDRGVVDRVLVQGRCVFVPTDQAESWVASQSGLAPYRDATLELIAALRREQNRRSQVSRP